MTVLQIRNEIGTYNNVLNMFIKTFDLNIFNLQYLDDYTLKELRDYHEVKPNLHELLISFSTQIREYHIDYYRWKTPKYIAKKTQVDLNLLIDYLNQNKISLLQYSYASDKGKFLDNFKKLENGNFTKDTEMNKISSYQILKNLQLDNRWFIINHIKPS